MKAETETPAIALAAEASSRLRADTKGANPAKTWAAVGIAFLALQSYSYGAWILGGRAQRTPAGPTPMPGWMQASVLVWQVLSPALAILALYFLVVRGWRRERRLTFDGMLCLAFISTFWQDSLLNYIQPWCTYNASFINFGAWNSDIPGWFSPNGHLMAEPPLFSLSAYIWVFTGGVLLGNLVMSRAARHWPALTKLGLISVCLGFFIMFDLVVELAFMRLGIWSYPGAIRSLSLFPGKYYQFPLYEGILFPACWTLWSALRFFRDDRGLTVAERGLDRLRISDRKKTGIRLLALVGILNAVYLGVYNIPIQLFGLHADTWPQDVTDRSYLTNGFCGPGTDRACPAPHTPVPRRGSTYVDPSGRLGGP